MQVNKGYEGGHGICFPILACGIRAFKYAIRAKSALDGKQNENVEFEFMLRIIYILADKILFGRHPFVDSFQRGVQRILSGPRDVTFKFRKGPARGCRFSCLTSNRYYFLREDYEHDLLQPLMHIVRDDSVVFDVGAHFGYWAIVLSRLCPDGEISAFEPSPENLVRLRKNIALNSVSNIHVVPFAASDRIGVAYLSGSGSTAAVGSAAVGSAAVSIETTTLDEFCKTSRIPEVMLIDVEGHAAEVLRGASCLLRNRFIPTICEVHSTIERDSLVACAAAKGAHITILGNSSRFPYRIVAA